jgi:hypothetical protein
VKVGVGQTVSGIDIILSASRAARISGTAVDSRGQPLRTGFVMAMQQRPELGPMLSSRSGQIRPDGTFTIGGVTAGTYQLRVAIPPPRPGTPPEILVATTTVAGEDVTGVVIAPLQPATISGRILFDPPTPSVEAASFRIAAMPKNPGTMIPMPMGGPGVNEDFTFELQAAPGETMIRGMSWAGRIGS